MAAPTNTFQTTAAIGNREDLADVIYRIAPTETPFISALERVDASGTYHEWQTQDLAAAANNARAEGDDAVADAATPTGRVGNYTQISTKTASVSGTQEAVKKAGRGSEMTYQLALKGLELKRDIEFAACQNGTHASGATRQMRGLEGWVITNASYGVGGAAPNVGTNAAATDGTTRAFTEALLKTVLQGIWTEGGKPDMLMLGGQQKQVFSGFNATVNNTRDIMAADKKVVATIEVYVSDFGTVKAVPNRFQRNRTAFVIESDKWALATLPGRSMKKIPLAKTGDSERVQLLNESTLEARQQKSSGAVRDLS